jgi:hypothetical protein
MNLVKQENKKIIEHNNEVSVHVDNALYYEDIYVFGEKYIMLSYYK